MRLIFEGKHNNRMPELILLIQVAEDPRGELRASTVRKPRAAPGAHVAHSAFARSVSVFNVCPAGDARIL